MILAFTFINLVGDGQTKLKNVWQIDWLRRLLFFSKQVVPRISSARPISEIARPHHPGERSPSLPYLPFTR
jgi:hypothetical protein